MLSGQAKSNQTIFTRDSRSCKDASLAFTVRALHQGRVVEADGNDVASVGLCRRQVTMTAEGATRPRPIRISLTGSTERVDKLDKIFDAQRQSTVLPKHKQLLNNADRRGTWPEQEADEMEKDQRRDTIHIVVPGAAWSGSLSYEHGLHAACNA